MTKTIGFLGLGHMGGPMAANLVRAGYDVLAYDPVPAAQDQARADGATVVATAVEAAADRDVVITMLPNGKLVLDVYAELLPAAAPGTLFLCWYRRSLKRRGTIRDIPGAVKSAGDGRARFADVDAPGDPPVSRGPGAAQPL